MRRLRWLVVLGVVSGAAAVAVSSAAAISTDPARCADGGWATVQADDGGWFRNEKKCVKYVQNGGTLYAPGINTVSFCLGGGTRSELEIVLWDFHPGAVVTLTLHGGLWRNGTDTLTVTVTSEDVPNPGLPGQAIFQASVIMAPSAPGVVTVSDAHGLAAHSSFVNRCTA